jgi:hypothetical protein
MCSHEAHTTRELHPKFASLSLIKKRLWFNDVQEEAAKNEADAGDAE